MHKKRQHDTQMAFEVLLLQECGYQHWKHVEMISALKTKQSLHHAGLRVKKHKSKEEEAEGTPTRPDDDRHGSLLNDGSYSREGGEAAVVSSAVLLHRVREVKVSVQAHRHPLILFYMLQFWAQKKNYDFISKERQISV